MYCCHEGSYGGLILGVWIRPTGSLLGFPNGLQHVLVDAIAELSPRSCPFCSPRRPSTDQGLIKEVFVIPRRSFGAIHHPLFICVHLPPATDVSSPESWNLRKYINAGANIFGTFAIVCRSVQEAVRPGFRALLEFTMELFRRDTEFAGITSHLV